MIFEYEGHSETRLLYPLMYNVCSFDRVKLSYCGHQFQWRVYGKTTSAVR